MMRVHNYTRNIFSLVARVVVIALFTHVLNAGVYVAPDGNDINPGTIDLPFKTLSKGASALKGNDTVFVRGGTYALSATISISKAGADTLQYYIVAYPGEHPVFDFSAQTSSDGIKLNGMYWHVYGLEIFNSAHNGIAINGSHNTVENCSLHDNRNTGLQLGNGASYNNIINCDSYNNYDPPLGGNADGFAPKLDVGTGNYFYGCRSWQNSDDGWDGYMRPADNVTTTIENCWSFMNGYLKDGSPIASGNGNGFKMGGGDNSNADSLRHNMILKNCLSFDNRVKGYDQNNNRGSMTLLNCTAYRNGAENFKISAFIRVTSTLTVKNCVSVDGKVSLANFAIQQTNGWNGPFVITPDDFAGVDTTGIRGPRKPDGSLPDVQFVHLAAGSDLINAGTDVGIPFIGSAPDLGAFEFGNVSGVVPSHRTAASFALEQNFPNPFNPSTTITYRMPAKGRVVMRVFDILGTEITTLVDGVRDAGEYHVQFDGSTLSSGIYFYQVQTDAALQTKKMMLLK